MAGPPTMDVSPQAFVSAWTLYLEALRTAVNARLERIDDTAFLNEFSSLYRDVFEALLSDSLLGAAEVAVAAALDETDGAETLAYLMRELTAYAVWQQAPAVRPDNTRVVRPGTTAGEAVTEAGPDALGAGQTIKESVEKFLKGKISGRLGKVLKVLNELLSIVRGG